MITEQIASCTEGVDGLLLEGIGLCERNMFNRLDVLRTASQQRVDVSELLAQKLRIMTIPGVGDIVAATLDACIGDVTRFPNAKALAAYVGLVPSVRQSGDTNVLGRITKQGSPQLRRLLVQAAHAVGRRATKPVQERRHRRSTGAMEEAGDGIGVGDDLEDAHAAAALAAEGDVDGEDPGEEIGPTDAARSGRGIGGGLGARVGERQREPGPGRQRLGPRDDAGAEPMMAREDAVIAVHVKAWRRDQGAQPRHELLGVHVDVGNAETRGLLEEDAHTTVRERLDGIVGEGWAQQVAAQALKLLAGMSTAPGGRARVVIVAARMWTDVEPSAKIRSRS